MINLLRSWDKDKTIPKPLYYRLYPSQEKPHKFYSLLKIHDENLPLRPIVSITGSIAYQAVKYLASVLRLLVDLS